MLYNTVHPGKIACGYLIYRYSSAQARSHLLITPFYLRASPIIQIPDKLATGKFSGMTYFRET
ncbi:MAG: hypothetical protein DRP93_08680 [Candidatus Neomarinimicrobiota bacterium]|nr:MAG: hypothetical protein DRP93_08680 [Candidatus Neomarinimicrobiota bacterium]